MTNELKERPILFSAPMVRAILDGRKSMTRRVVKLSDKDLHDDSAYLNGGSAAVALGHGVGRIVEWREQNGQWFGLSGYTTVANIDCPYGQVGDRLWVRETFTTDRVYKDSDIVDGDTVYRASMPVSYTWPDHLYDLTPPKWKPAIHMPRWASRIDLEITGVRVERFQAITPEDAIAEGLVTMPEFNWTAQKPTGRILAETAGSPPYWASPKTAFESLWENINGAGSWEANPFVWVVSFRRIKP